ncbi:MAG TPA: glycosyltransferase family 4 protein, partial [Lentisphaeria bacterium]|nr:glycosyltransferase family 4 protein [Lentisphaeria bacterium]
ILQVLMADCAEAFSRLPRTGNLAQAHLLLFGVVYDPTYVQCLRQRIAELGLDDHVTFICNLDYESPDLADAYAAADLFVLPSRYETFGIVILEAWSAGKPVIAGRVGGIADYGIDGQNLLFADVESPESIAENIQKIASDPELAADLARQGQEYARQNSWEKIAAALIDAYEQKPL